MVASSEYEIDWDITQIKTLTRIQAEIATNLTLKDGFSDSKQRFYLIEFLKKFYSSVEYPQVAKIVTDYTSLPIALRFSRLTIKDMLLVESDLEDDQDDKIIQNWRNMAKLAQRLFENPKAIFLHSLMEDFWKIEDTEIYRSFTEFLIILVSQNETKRFVKYLIKDSLFILRLKRDQMYYDSIVLKQLVKSLESYLYENEEASYANLSLMKKLASKDFPKELAHSSTNHQNESGSLVGRQYIQKSMENVEYDIIFNIAQKLRINTQKVENLFEDEETRREILIELIGGKLESRNIIKSGESVESTPSLISEKELYDEENTTTPVILNYNSLDIMDYSFRLFHGSRRELVKSIRTQVNYLNDVIQPQFNLQSEFDGYEGWNKDAAPLNYCRILTIKQARIARNFPDKIIAEAEFDLTSFSSSVQEMWMNLRNGEILAFVQYRNTKFGVEVGTLRCGEIQSIVYTSQNPEKRKSERQSYLLDQKLRVFINFDPVQFKKDQQEALDEGFDIDTTYQNFHIAMRMKRDDSAIKHALDKIKVICAENKGKELKNDNIVFEKMYNLKFDQQEDKEFVNLDENLPYERLFEDKKDFEERFLKNEMFPAVIRENLTKINTNFENNHNSDEKQKFSSYKLTQEQINGIISGV